MYVISELTVSVKYRYKYLHLTVHKKFAEFCV